MAGNIWFTWDLLWIFAYAVVSRLVIFGLLLSTEAEKNRTVSFHVQQNKNSSLEKQQFYQPFCNETRARAILISVEWWHWSKVSLLAGTLVHVHDINNHIISFLVLPQLTLSVSQNLRLLTLVITEGLDPTCFARKTFLSDSSTSSLLHSDLIVSVNSDDSAINLFCWFSSCAHNKFIKMMRSFQICFSFFSVKGVEHLTSVLSPLRCSILSDESLNVVSASLLASSFSMEVDGTVSISLHSVWIDCFNSLKVFNLFP